MNKTIDCLLIGHNEMNFVEYEKSLRDMSVNSGAYRDLNLDFVRFDNQLYTASGIFNLFYGSDKHAKGFNKPVQLTETFNAAIAYLGTYLQRRGLTFDYINSFQQEKEELIEKLQQDNILTIAITTTLYVSVLPILEIMATIKKYNHRARIIVGGPFISTQVRTRDADTLEYLFRTIGADVYVNSSQGEAALVKVIKALKENMSLSPIENIYYLENGKSSSGYQGTAMIPENNRLSENMVDWRLFAGDRVGQFVNLRTAISCPFACAFCGFPEHAGTYQVAEVDAIEKELTLLHQHHQVKSIHFIDDTFNVPPKRFKEICKMMIKNRINSNWHSHFRAQFADREIVELMKESGCEGVFLGIESGSNEILGNMNKRVTTDKYYKGIELLKEYGILVYGSFIIGFPGETEDTVNETIQFIKQSALDFFRAQIWYCEPITPIWKEREKYKLQGNSFEWSHITMNSQRAVDLLEEIFCSIESPIWVPQYNFEFDALFHLFHRGISMEKVRTFLKAFNQGVKEKIRNPTKREISIEVIRQIKAICQENPVPAASASRLKQDFNKYNADFEF